MPDIFTYGADLLLRTDPLGHEEWMQLLESRRLLLKQHLDKFSLERLGEIECLSSESHYHKINQDHPEVVAEADLDLDTQGIFGRGETTFEQVKVPSAPWSGWGPETETLGGVVNLWGLSRKGEWLVIQVEFKREPGYKNRGNDRAVRVTAKTTTVSELAEVALSPQYVWDQLGQTVAQWTEQRLRLYLQANELLAVIRAASAAVSEIGYRTEVVEK